MMFYSLLLVYFLPRFVFSWLGPHQQIEVMRGCRRTIIKDGFKLTANTFDDEDCADLCPLEDFDEEVTSINKQKDEKHVSAETERMQSNRGRLLLEMNWEMRETEENCDIDDVLSCSLLCDECNGSGSKSCRFCKGDKQISFSKGNSRVLVDCPTCDQNGNEVCGTCCGSGRVARWIDLAEFYQKNGNKL